MSIEMGRRRIGLVAATCLVNFIQSASANPIQPQGPIDAYALMSGRDIQGCVVRSKHVARDQTFETLVQVRKTNRGNVFSVSVTGTGTDNARDTAAIRNVSVKLIGSNLGRELKAVASVAGAPNTSSVSASFDATSGAMFMQALMVQGAQVGVTLGDGSTLELSLPGPMPASVRSSYLHCSGDVYRP
jgi:hypothetical protein